MLMTFAFCFNMLLRIMHCNLQTFTIFINSFWGFNHIIWLYFCSYYEMWFKLHEVGLQLGLIQTKDRMLLGIDVVWLEVFYLYLIFYLAVSERIIRPKI